MKFTKAFALIPLIIIVSSVLVASGGGYTGVRFYQREKLAKEGDELFRQGEYEKAAEVYQRAISKWGNDRIRESLNQSREMATSSQFFNQGIAAYEQKNWSACIEGLGQVLPTFVRHDEAQIKLLNCQDQQNAENAAKAAAELAVSQAATKTQAKTSTKTVSQQTSTVNTTASNNNTDAATSSADTSNTSSVAADEPEATCVSNTSPTFTHHLTDISKVNEVVIPPRHIGGELKTHSYIGTGTARVPVYAPTAMKLIGGVHLSHDGAPNDYGMDFEVSCEVKVRIGHITEPIQSIADTFPTAKVDSYTNYDITPINFAAGDLIGYTVRGENGNWDFGVYNSSTSNKYASDPNWNTSWVYKTSVCPFQYFRADIQSAYVSKYETELGDSVLDGGVSFCQ